jgi:hypothetical protein
MASMAVFQIVRKSSNLLFCTKNLGTKTGRIAAQFGGNWKYCGGFSGRWECDDGRAVQKYTTYWDDDYRDYGKTFTYYLYENDKATLCVVI